MDPYTVAGFVGVAAIVAAYFANQQGWLSSEDWRFPAANLVGSLLILASLWTAWNFPSVVIEVIWAAISLYGLSRRLRWPALDRLGAEPAGRGAAAAASWMRAERRRDSAARARAADGGAGQGTRRRIAAGRAGLRHANSAIGRDSPNGPQRSQS